MRFCVVVLLTTYLSMNYVKAVDDFEFTDTGIKISYNISNNQLTFNSEEDISNLKSKKGYIAFSPEVSQKVLETFNDFPDHSGVSNTVSDMNFKDDSQTRHVVMCPDKIICLLGKPTNNEELQHFQKAQFKCIEGPVDVGVCAFTSAIRARYIVKTQVNEFQGHPWATCDVLISLNKKVEFKVSEKKIAN